MFIDTHSHINCIVKNKFDVLLTAQQQEAAFAIVEEARAHQVTTIINVGTSFIESENCVALTKIPGCYAIIGIHPNDCTASWAQELTTMKKRWLEPRDRIEERRIVGIGESGIDRHYPDTNLQRQYDAFRAHIEMALTYDLALSIHSRDAADETLKILDEYAGESLRGVIHCFSYDQAFAEYVINKGFVLGIGGTLTYPKNSTLRDVATRVPLTSIVLETDAPFLPPQSMRGKQNRPYTISLVAQFLAQLRQEPIESVAATIAATTKNIFRI